jgi:peptidoglycan/xylan/chitin deacetylase (PgdA/CDA1 family)
MFRSAKSSLIQPISVAVLLSKLKGVFLRLAKRGGGDRFFAWVADRYQEKKNAAGHPVFPYIKKRRERTCQILAYHRINDENDPFFPGLPTSQFARQMEVLAERFTLCSLDRLLQGIQSGDLPEHGVAVTFDDGYRDNYVNAFPVLKRYAVPATIFLATGVIGCRKPLWHDRVFAILRETRIPELSSFGPENTTLSLRSLADKLQAQRQILKHLWSLDAEARESTIAELCHRLEADDTEKDALMLSWEEVSEMSRDGIQFGAHTVNHPVLARLRPEEARQEICGSKRAIEAALNTAVTNFAYPVGRSVDFTATTKTMVQEAGLSCGLTMIFGNNPPGTDSYEIRRIAPWNEDADAFGLRLKYYKFCS